MTSDRARSLSLFDVCNVTVHVHVVLLRPLEKFRRALLHAFNNNVNLTVGDVGCACISWSKSKVHYLFLKEFHCTKKTQHNATFYYENWSQNDSPPDLKYTLTFYLIRYMLPLERVCSAGKKHMRGLYLNNELQIIKLIHLGCTHTHPHLVCSSKMQS